VKENDGGGDLPPVITSSLYAVDAPLHGVLQMNGAGMKIAYDIMPYGVFHIATRGHHKLCNVPSNMAPEKMEKAGRAPPFPRLFF